jgi:3-deoxy-D-manno-octulosonic-acid transferase
MRYGLYNAAWALAAPAGALWLRTHARHRELSDRFHPPAPVLDAPVWVHACSVGEVTTAKPILAALRRRFPEIPLLLTTSTVAGRALAREACAEYPLTWCPFDAPGSVRRFLDHVRPRALVLIETELWPNLLRECSRRGTPAILVNGRVSDKHYPRYLRFRGLFREALRHLTLAGVQTPLYAERLRALGADPAIVRVTGNTKFDAVATVVDARTRARLRLENGFPPECPVLVFGSTRPGDESLAAACWRTLRGQAGLRLVVAPRHLERLDEALAPFAGEAILWRSAVKAGRAPAGERVFFLDTVGELAAFYSMASIAVVGGSWYPGVNGHNPLEPAALGVATVFGPYMSNFPEPAKALVQARGAIQVQRPEDLEPTLKRLLADTTEQHCYGTRARKAVLDNRGAVERNVDLIQEALRMKAS